jgi:hypothetical protein
MNRPAESRPPRAPPLPFSGPAWLTPTRAALATIGIGVPTIMTGANVAFNGALDTRDDALTMLVTVGSIAAILLMSSHVAMKRPSVSASARASLLGSAVAGVLLLAVPFALDFARGRSPEGMAALLLVPLLFGPLVGLWIGVLPTFVVVEVARGRASPSHDAIDYAIVASGSALAAVALTSMLMVRLAGRSWAPFGLWTSALLSLGLGLMAAATLRVVLRARWIERLRSAASGTAAMMAGEGGPSAPAFRVEKWAPSDRDAALMPISRSKSTYAPAVLLFSAGEESASYRTRSPRVPVASIPADSAQAPRGLTTHAINTTVPLLLIGGLMALLLNGCIALSLAT